jgi:hypothetical protein
VFLPFHPPRIHRRRKESEPTITTLISLSSSSLS